MAPTFSSEPAALLAEPLTTDASSSASSSLVGLSHLHPPTTLILDANANAFRREGADHTWIWMICVLLAVTAHAIYNFGFLRKFDRLRDAPAPAAAQPTTGLIARLYAAAVEPHYSAPLQ